MLTSEICPEFKSSQGNVFGVNDTEKHIEHLALLPHQQKKCHWPPDAEKN